MVWLLLLSFILNRETVHPLYLSTCQINIGTDGSWQGTVRIFQNDLEDAIHNQNNVRPNLISANLKEHVTNMQKYLEIHLRFRSKNAMHNYLVTECSLKDDVVTLQLLGNGRWPVGDCTIKNDILTELFEAQKNVMIIKSSDGVQTLYFTKKSNQLTLKK